MAKQSLATRATNPMVMTKLMFLAARTPRRQTPTDAGLEYESVTFPATDGVKLSGWFIPRDGDGDGDGDGPGPVVVFVHGWLWNRLGNTSGRVPFVDRDVDFLPPTKALHDAGFNVLLFDVRHHGESGRGRKPLSYGPIEARDFIGAVNYLRSRPDVDGERIGAIGTSMGGNIVMYGTPECQPIKAILAVQPTRIAKFNDNFARSELGPRVGPPMLAPIELVYRLLGTPTPSAHDPAIPAAKLGSTVVQYVQGTGDQWGTMEIVEEFSAATPNSLGVVAFPSAERYEGYRYVSERTDEVVAFFREHV